MSDPQLIIDAANGLLKSQAAEIERLKAENKRFREAGHRLEAALDAIDTSLMSEQALAADTKAVGGPVSDYSISYDEQAVVNRVAAEVERLKEVEDTASAAFKTVSDQIQEIERLTAEKADLVSQLHDQGTGRASFSAGMERAAVIADRECDGDPWKHAGSIAAAIRAEIKE